MSLRKSPVVSAAMLAANRANAQKSTGPRTEAGKAISSLNRLKHGGRSRFWQEFHDALWRDPDYALRNFDRFIKPHHLTHWKVERMLELMAEAFGYRFGYREVK